MVFQMNWFIKISGTPYNTGSMGSLYHGSNKILGKFDLSFSGARDWGDYGLGVYLSPSSGLAKMYAEEAVKADGGTPVIHVVKADLKNMATEEELFETIRELNIPVDKDTKINEEGKQTRPEIDSRSIASRMQEKGFDSAKVRTEIVVYDPEVLTIVRNVPADKAYLLP